MRSRGAHSLSRLGICQSINFVNQKLFTDFVTFGREQIACDDLDPAYPVLRALLAGLEPEQKLWFLTLYLGYYNLPSALSAFRALPLPKSLWNKPDVLRLACATERRGLRGGKVRDNIESYLCLAKFGQEKFLQSGWGDSPEENYLRFWETIQKVWGNGRWAAFKMAELLKDVLGWNLAAPDLRLKHCSGPRAGLEMLTELQSAPVAQLEKASVALKLQAAIAGLEADWEGIETVLCDFHSLAMGTYYLGHDIDGQWEQVMKAPLAVEDRDRLLEIRSQVFRAEYLCERGDWEGIETARKSVYRKRQEILIRRPLIAA
jgi:hypothetical protein